MNRKITVEERNAARLAAAERRRELLSAEKSISDERRAELLAANIRTVDGAALSPKNTVLVMLQASALGVVPSLVGGFKQWRDNGRRVRKGARGLLIAFPKVGKDQETGTDVLNGFGWGYVFDVSQTVDAAEPEPITSDPVTVAAQVAVDTVEIEQESATEEVQHESATETAPASDIDAIMAAIAAA